MSFGEFWSVLFSFGQFWSVLNSLEIRYNLFTINLRKFSEILGNSQFFEPIICEIFEIAAVQKDANLVESKSNIRYLRKIQINSK